MISIKLFALLIVASVAAAGDLVGVDPNTLSCDPSGHVFLLLPHYTDCHKYFMCAHGNEVEFTCAGNTIFDFEGQTCNWDWATKCWLRDNSEDIEGSGSGSGDEPSIDEGSGDEPSIDEDFLDAPSLVPEITSAALDEHSVLNAILNCRTMESASLQVAYRGDCQRYWRCENRVPQAVYCSDGLYFNPASRQCDYEANVKCHVPQEDELQGEFIVYK